MDPIDVTARFNTAGKATPLRFTWKGQEYQVNSTGRRWEDNEGEHILVMVPGGKVFELLIARRDGRWYLSQTGPRISAA
ncbi:MAG: hypothetical protein EHM70_11820 [Chloroflexota bacterium]|nr:MAG: hypothetical protein EHM70_11820 [Chloroflexota bacterium]